MYSYYTYAPSAGEQLYTMVWMPEKDGKYPTIIMRNPYVQEEVAYTPEESLKRYEEGAAGFVAAGYAVVHQHCRGCGHSTGDFIPYVLDREDGLNLHEWIRHQSFYDGTLLLYGGSYTASVHYDMLPLAPDIKGALLSVYDPNHYNAWYTGGAMNLGLQGDWYAMMYKQKSLPGKRYNVPDVYLTLPAEDIPYTVFGEHAKEFEEIMRHPEPDDPFWATDMAVGFGRHGIRDINVPTLFLTSHYDIVLKGIIEGWKERPAELKKHSALVVGAYGHGDEPVFPGAVSHKNGARSELMGPGAEVRWFNYVLGKGEPPVKLGVASHYRLYDECWAFDNYEPGQERMELTLGTDAVTYTYNPYAPPKFKGGLSHGFGESVPQDKAGSRPDVISVYTEPFAEDTFVQGKMEAEITISSDCEDTGVYARIDIEKPEGDFGIRDSITSLCRHYPDYVPGQKAKITLSMDDHSFLIHKGERLRVDITSANAQQFLRHTNCKGPFWKQDRAKIARNTVYLGECKLILPVQKEI